MAGSNGAEPVTVAEWATEALGYLYRQPETDRVLPVAEAPEWFGELCRIAHNDMMPDDWRYEFIQDALSALSESEGQDVEEVEPDVDSLYPYTADRLRWLSSRLDRTSYCDNAVAEMGWPFTDTDDLISHGMWWELREVFGLVRQYLEERVEETEEDS